MPFREMPFRICPRKIMVPCQKKSVLPFSLVPETGKKQMNHPLNYVKPGLTLFYMDHDIYDLVNMFKSQQTTAYL